MSDFMSDLSKEINKDLGEEVTFLLEDGSPSDVKIFIPTGSTLLDTIISNQYPGGIPVGKITEISGLEGTGKTLLAMQIAANAQKMGGYVIYIDTENAFNSDFATRAGLDVNAIMYTTPSTVEDVFTIVFKTVTRIADLEKKEKELPFKFVLIIWDSVASTPTKIDVDTENPNPAATVGVKPRILSKNIATLIRSTGRKNVALLFVNQLRMKIGAMPFTDPYETPGGKAIPYAASARVRLQTAGKIKIGPKDSEEIVGVDVAARVVKTRFGPPFRSTKMPLYFSHGIDDVEGMLDFAETNDLIITKSGGPKGKQFSWKEAPQITMVRKEFKKTILKDEKLKDKLKKLCGEALIKDLKNPELEDLVIDKDTSGLE